MEVMTIDEYNRRQLIKYDEACRDWDYTKGGFPCLAFYCFWGCNGKEKHYGYVATGNNRSYWAKTKKQARLNWIRN